MPRFTLIRLVVLALGVGNLGVSVKWINTYAGPFVTVLGPRWDLCPAKPTVKLENLIKCNIRVSQYRNPALEAGTHLQRISGNVTLDIPLDDSLWIYLKAASRSNNQWKENALVMNFPGGACSATLHNFPDFFLKVYHMDAKTHKGPCLIPKGVYSVEDAPVNWTIPKFPVFKYGTYRLEIGYNMGPVANPRHIMCFLVDVFLQPAV